MGIQTSRRGMLGAMALAPLVATVPAAAMPAPSHIDGIIAAYRVAEAACEPASEAHGEALRTWTAACEAIPHYTTKRGYQSQGLGFRHLSTSDRTAAPAARAVIEVTKKSAEADDYHAVCHELVAAADARKAEADRLRALHGVDAARDEEERLAEIGGNALWAVIECPVSSPADLLTKLAFMTETGHFGDTDATVAVGDDIRRVLKVRRI
jgi:hypothetical protein